MKQIKVLFILVFLFSIFANCRFFSKIKSYSKELSEMRLDLQAIKLSDYEKLQVMDKDYKRIINNRLNRNGIDNYYLFDDNLNFPFKDSNVIVSS